MALVYAPHVRNIMKCEIQLITYTSFHLDNNII